MQQKLDHRDARPWDQGVLRLAIVGCLLLAFAGQAMLSMSQKSLTVDEADYIGAGYYHVRTRDFTLNRTNPPLTKILSGLPLLLFDLYLPDLGPERGDYHNAAFTGRLLYENRVDPDTLIFAARMPTVIIGMVLGVYIYLWSLWVFGASAALLSLALYSFSPTMLAHTRLATQDLPLAAFLFIATYYFCRYWQSPSWRTLLLGGAAFGAGAATKSVIFVVIPAGAIWQLCLGLSRLAALRHTGASMSAAIPDLRRALKQIMAIGAVCVVSFLLFLNIAYLFSSVGRPMEYDRYRGVQLRLASSSLSIVRSGADLMSAAVLPVPQAYLDSIQYQRRLIAKVRRPLYWKGEVSEEGWRHLIMSSFLIKTPISMLLLLSFAIVSVLVTRGFSRNEWPLLIIPLLLFSIFSYYKSISMGLRYVLPAFPFLFVLSARPLTLPVFNRLPAKLALAVLLAWYGFSSISIYPHYLAYFNEFIGGPKNGYHYLTDSDLDWGQDLKGLARYMRERSIPRIRLGGFQRIDPKYYGIEYMKPDRGLEPGQDTSVDWSKAPLAVRAFALTGIDADEYYRPLLNATPIDHIGYSIMIFDPETVARYLPAEPREKFSRRDP